MALAYAQSAVRPACDLLASSSSSTSHLPAFVGLRGSSLCSPSAISKTVQLRQISRPSTVSVRAATTVAPTYTQLKPLADRVLVKIQQVEEKTMGGILLPTTAQTKPQGGEVVAVGEGRTMGGKKIKVDVENGSSIVYSKYAGTEVEFQGVPHVLLKEDDIVGVLNTDDIKDLKPLNDRVLLKVLETESKTAGGVLLTESAKEKPVVGSVVAVGPGSLEEDGSRKPLDITPGSTALYSKFAGNDFKSKDGAQYVVLRSSDVMAVLS